ncbi:MAG: hypothetical protein H6755_04970 [Candidatus Omnitrophica bacterium]|nr:hypothetical protein [Candidatus Omnitrophota bacterium]
MLFCLLALNGCAMLQAPLQLLQLPFQLLGEAFKLIGKLPKPPPGVFF